MIAENTFRLDEDRAGTGLRHSLTQNRPLTQAQDAGHSSDPLLHRPAREALE